MNKSDKQELKAELQNKGVFASLQGQDYEIQYLKPDVVTNIKLNYQKTGQPRSDSGLNLRYKTGKFSPMLSLTDSTMGLGCGYIFGNDNYFEGNMLINKQDLRLRGGFLYGRLRVNPCFEFMQSFAPQQTMIKASYSTELTRMVVRGLASNGQVVSTLLGQYKDKHTDAYAKLNLPFSYGRASLQTAFLSKIKGYWALGAQFSRQDGQNDWTAVAGANLFKSGWLYARVGQNKLGFFLDWKRNGNQFSLEIGKGKGNTTGFTIGYNLKLLI